MNIKKSYKISGNDIIREAWYCEKHCRFYNEKIIKPYKLKKYLYVNINGKIMNFNKVKQLINHEKQIKTF